MISKKNSKLSEEASDNRTSRRYYEIILMFAGLFSIALGLVVLAGWHTHDITLVQIQPNFVPMAYNTAWCFVLCGAGLLLTTLRQPRIVTICGVVVAIFGFLTLIQHISGVDFGFDRLLMRGDFGGEADYHVKMAFNTAICLVLIGTSLVAAVLPKPFKKRSLMLAIIGSVIGMLGTDAFYGYLVGVKITYGWGNAIPMAVHAAVGFYVLGFGVIALAWKISKAEQPETPRWFPLVIGASGLTATFTLWRALAAVEAAAGIYSYLPLIVLFVGILTSLLFAWAIYFLLENERFPIVILPLTLFLTGVVFSWLIWDDYNSYNTRSEIKERTFQVEKLRATFVHLDDKLTMLAKVAATTGNTRLEEQYRPLELQIEPTIQEIKQLTQNDDSQAVTQIDASSVELTKMENQAFALLREGRAEQARAILSSDEYETQKILFSEGMTSVFAQVENSLDKSLYAERSRAVLSVIAGIIILGLSILAWFAVIKNLRSSRDALSASLDELKSSEEARFKAESYRNLFQLANDSILIFEPENEIILDVNDKACEVYGFSRDEFIGKSLKEITQDVERGERQLAELLARGTYHSLESVNFHADGTPINFLINASVIEHQGQPAVLSINRDITDRKQAEEILRESEARYRVVTESASDAIITIDREHTILFVNSAAEKIFGYTVDEMLGKHLFMLIPERMRDAHKAGMARYAKTNVRGIPWKEVELPALHKDGHEVPIEITFGEVNSDGKHFFTAVIRDITERKQAAETLQKTVSLLTSTFEATADGILVVDLNDNIVTFNKKLVEMWQIPEEFVKSRDKVGAMNFVFKQVKNADAIVKTTEKLKINPEKELHDLIEFIDGRIFERYSHPQISGGKVNGRVISFRDITVRERAETALRESEYKLRTLISSMSEGLLQVDLDDRIEFVNDCFCEMTGFDREELLGKITFDVIFDEEGSRLVRDANKDRLKGISDQYGMRLKTKSGEMLWVIVGGSPLVDVDGKVIGKMGVFTDITERKQSEVALRESEYKLRTLIGSMNEGLLQVDGEDCITFVNNCFCELVGYSQEELIGKNWSQLLLDNVGNAFITEVNKRRQKGISDRYELCLKKKSGETLFVMVGGVPILEAKGVVSGSMGVFTDITERKRVEEQLLHDAFHDGLTGLANRALFMDHLRLTIERGKSRHSNSYAVLFLDFDRFKVINDSLGHTEGDNLLKFIGQRLESATRAGDLVARLGGDEFVVLLSELLEEGDAVQIAERIQACLKNPFDLNGNEIFISASIGIALSASGHKRPEDMLRDADIAMYRAKATGKAQYQIFDRAMHEHASKQLQLETEMRRALEQREFLLHYQPIINLQTDELIGFEALVRWKHAERGMIPPNEFIPAAEENGLILPLGAWILEESCGQLRQWQENNPLAAGLTVSVNLSTKQFVQPDLADQIARTLKKTGLDPRCLKLEITESHVMENSEQAIVMMINLRTLGVELSLDDFGTGYSSLSYLHRLPVSFLKIDRSFVSRMIESRENSEIVHTIIKLAQNLKMKVIAEGIETDEQLTLLKNLKCEFGQGYFLSKPLENAVAAKLLNSSAVNLAPMLNNAPESFRADNQTAVI